MSELVLNVGVLSCCGLPRAECQCGKWEPLFNANPEGCNQYKPCAGGGESAGDDMGHGADRDLTGAPKGAGKGQRTRIVDSTTTHEGVKLDRAGSMSREQARDVISWHDRMTMTGENHPNGNLPTESHSANYSDTERGALQKYSYKNDGPLNNKLRGNPDWRDLKGSGGQKLAEVPYPDSFYEEMESQLDGAFAKTPQFAKPVTVVRGMNLDEKGMAWLKGAIEQGGGVGGEITLKGYTSTAATGGLRHKLGLKSNASFIPPAFRGNVEMTINAVHGIDMGPHTQLPGEGELLLPKNSSFRVKSVREKSGKLQVELDQIPHGTTRNRLTPGPTWQEVLNQEETKLTKQDRELLQWYKDHPEQWQKWVDTDASFVVPGKVKSKNPKQVRKNPHATENRDGNWEEV